MENIADYVSPVDALNIVQLVAVGFVHYFVHDEETQLNKFRQLHFVKYLFVKHL